MLKRNLIGSILVMAVAVLICMSATAWAGDDDYGASSFEVLTISVDSAALGDTYVMINNIDDPTEAAFMVPHRIPEVTKPEVDVVISPRHPLKCPCHSGTLGYGDDNGYDNCDKYGGDNGVLVMIQVPAKESGSLAFGNPGPQTGYLS